MYRSKAVVEIVTVKQIKFCKDHREKKRSVLLYLGSRKEKYQLGMKERSKDMLPNKW